MTGVVELSLAALSVAAISGDIVHAGKALRRIIIDKRNHLEDADSLHIQIQASVTQHIALKKLLFGLGEGDCLFEQLHQDIQLNIADAMHKLNAIMQNDCRTLEVRYHIGNVRVEEGISTETVDHGQGMPQSSKRQMLGASLRWALTGKKQANQAVDNFSKWNHIIIDHLRIFLYEREVLSRLSASEAFKLRSSDDALTLGISNGIEMVDIAEDTAAAVGDLATSPLRINLEDIVIGNKYSHLHAGQYHGRTVLVEEKTVIPDTQTPTLTEELNHRLFQLASFLNKANNPSLSVLKCAGVINRAENHSLVFEVPNTLEIGSTSIALEIETRPKPSLGARFRLAHLVASSLFELHLVGWLHKGLQSDKILLLRNTSTPSNNRDHASSTTPFGTPYIFGFEYARMETNESLGPAPRHDMAANVYRHPARWGTPTTSFTKLHDLYALGVVLTEIGLWIRVTTQVLGGNLDIYTDKEQLVSRRILDAVNINMAVKAGDTYAEIVRRCLTGDFGRLQGAAMKDEFREMIDDLGKLAAVV